MVNKIKKFNEFGKKPSNEKKTEKKQDSKLLKFWKW